MIDEDPSDRGEITLMISDIIKQQLPYLFHYNFDIDETFQNVTRLSIRKQGKIGWEANPLEKILLPSVDNKLRYSITGCNPTLSFSCPPVFNACAQS
jgi:hypothetical protein